ncbi:unnamed protein product [Phytophthora lilii]|uniref:Unnamed protein product n=1 Tax=Phytophthora lilii TaxID=2077276 RepID=A0A9W6U5N1_9STRA|nr:unnamed protein product [Phytophthora lilii]
MYPGGVISVPSSASHNQRPPHPVTISEKAAIKFKPQLKITNGCHPYPAVQANGSVSAGLKWTFLGRSGDCEGSPLGSQVYSRSAWHRDVWAIMYAWYFPKGRQATGGIGIGHRHNWEYAVVWINNPELDDPTILGVSMSAYLGYSRRAPPKAKYIDGNSVKLDYYFSDAIGNTALGLTKEAGETQELISWEQLPDVARDALSNTDWDVTPLHAGHVKMPLKDDVFNKAACDKVQPFAQPDPVTVFEKAAIKFRPQLKITDACYPHPAVQADGSVSAGVEWKFGLNRYSDCGGSPLGSQVYARSAWYMTSGPSCTLGTSQRDEKPLEWLESATDTTGSSPLSRSTTPLSTTRPF